MDRVDFRIRLIKGDAALIIEDINCLRSRIDQWREEGADCADSAFALDVARFDAFEKISQSAIKANTSLTQTKIIKT